MEFGLFGAARAERGGPDVDSGAGFKEFVQQNVEAEGLGYRSTFVVEHHFTGFGQVSATLNLLTWIAARTSTLRVGTAVIVLAWHNPVLLAEQTATLDLLSGGRLDFGIGKGYRHNEFAGFCVPMEEAEERFQEAKELLVRAWTSDTPWSYAGKYWRFDNVVVEPPAAQKPHPPIWMAAGSPESIKQVAANGYHLLLDQYAPPEHVGELIALFKGEVETQGRAFDPLSVAVTRSVYVTKTDNELQRALEMRLEGHRRIHRLAQRPDGQNRASFFSFADTLDAAAAGALYGTPDAICAKVEALRAAGAAYILLNSAGGRESLRRFASEVMPAFSGLAATGSGRDAHAAPPAS
jgi:alkanesulfonate monooxygenase SsuD/methylene tetrahydromethanopterin reductase-like flavin-dependent oxidoreductase (luciferase family)